MITFYKPLVVVDLKDPNSIKERTCHNPLCPEKKLLPESLFFKYMDNEKPNKYKPTLNMILNQTDRKKCITH